jgi:hypothetical protein
MSARIHAREQSIDDSLFDDCTDDDDNDNATASASDDDEVLFEADDHVRVRAASLSRLVDTLATQCAAQISAERDALAGSLRDDVDALFLCHRAFRVDSAELLALLLSRARHSPSLRPGVVAMLERWATVTPDDFFADVVTATPPTNLTATANATTAITTTTTTMAMASPAKPTVRPIKLPLLPSVSAVAADDADSSESVEESASATHSSSGSVGAGTGTPVQFAERKFSLRTRSAVTLGSVRSLRPEMHAFLGAPDHGPLGARVAAIGARLQCAVVPSSVLPRDVKEIDRLLDGMDIGIAPPATPTSAAAATAAALRATGVDVSDDEQLLAIEPVALAQVLFTVEHSLLVAIADAPQQLLKQAWSSADKAKLGPTSCGTSRGST